MERELLYAESLIKPDFEVSENAIKIVLPLFETNVNLTEDEKVIYKLLSKTMLKSISEIAPYVPFGKSKTTHLLKTMGEKGVVAVEEHRRFIALGSAPYIRRKHKIMIYDNREDQFLR